MKATHYLIAQTFHQPQMHPFCLSSLEISNHIFLFNLQKQQNATLIKITHLHDCNGNGHQESHTLTLLSSSSQRRQLDGQL